MSSVVSVRRVCLARSLSFASSSSGMRRLMGMFLCRSLRFFAMNAIVVVWIAMSITLYQSLDRCG